MQSLKTEILTSTNNGQRYFIQTISLKNVILNVLTFNAKIGCHNKVFNTRFISNQKLIKFFNNFTFSRF